MSKVLLFCFLVFAYVPKTLGADLYSHEKAKEKIKPILVKLKNGVAKKDLEILSEIILFPLNISSGQMFTGTDGKLKIRTRTINDINGLDKEFDSIFVPVLKELIQCVSADNMLYNRYKGFSAAYGAIWFLDIIENDKGIRRFALTSLSTNEVSTNKWLAKQCNESKVSI